MHSYNVYLNLSIFSTTKEFVLFCTISFHLSISHLSIHPSMGQDTYQVMAEIYQSLLLYFEVLPSQMASVIHPVGSILTTVSPSWPCREDLQRDASMRRVQTTKTPKHFSSFVWASDWPPTWRRGFIQTTIISDSVYVHLVPLINREIHCILLHNAFTVAIASESRQIVMGHSLAWQIQTPRNPICLCRV